MDPKANGQLQTEWGWLIAIYLFLGGVGAGAYTIAAINGFMGEGLELSTTVGLWISFPALLLGSAFLLADLGAPARAVLAGMKPGTSWIARGFWIITIFMVLSFIHFLLHRSGNVAGGAVTLVSVLGIVFAVLTMAYTGVLLGSSKGMPFWRTGIVPVVFVVSALVTGHFAIMLGVTVFGEAVEVVAPLRTMALEAAVLVALEILVIVFFLQAAFKLPDSRESVQRILRRRLFWAGYLTWGLVVPLILMLHVYATMGSGGGGVGLGEVMGGALLGLMGGLILRQAILACGALPTWNMAGFKFRRIARPKDPKPAMGMLPPS